jgi:hypothetical protein
MSYKGIFHTDTLSEVLNIPSLGDVYIDTSKDEEVKSYGMIHNRPHTESAKQKMRETRKPGLHKGGTIIAPNGKIVKFNCLSDFCKEHGLSVGHVSEMMNGKVRKSVKGWIRG